jgi:hypothetical protein
MRIIDDLTNYIENNTNLIVTDIDSFYTTESSAIMILQTPGQFAEKRYYDGARSGIFEYDILTKNMNSQICVSQLEELEKLLDFPNGLILEYGSFTKGETVKSATKVGDTDKNEKIYSSSFKLEYYYQGV